MPTVARVGPYRLFFFGNEGFEPPHVHVQRDRRVAEVWLQPVSFGLALAGSQLRPARCSLQAQARKISMPLRVIWLRTEGKSSKACWAPGISA